MTLQVNCLSAHCGMGGLNSDPAQPRRPAGPWQWWRLPIAVLYHHGVVDTVITVAIQLLVSTQIEMVAGGLRVATIYWLSATTGLMVGRGRQYALLGS